MDGWMKLMIQWWYFRSSSEWESNDNPIHAEAIQGTTNPRPEQGNADAKSSHPSGIFVFFLGNQIAVGDITKRDEGLHKQIDLRSKVTDF